MDDTTNTELCFIFLAIKMAIFLAHFIFYIINLHRQEKKRRSFVKRDNDMTLLIETRRVYVY